MFWFVKTVHLYSAGSESRTGLSYVNVVCVGGFKIICGEGQNFSTCFVCVCVGGGGGQVQYLSFREKK